MKNNFIYFSFLFGLSLIMLSCAEEQPENEKKLDSAESFYIEFGTECGWCAGTEFIKVTESQVEYTRFIPCGDEIGTTTNNRELENSEWEQLLNSFDTTNFKKLDYNTCNVCVDGCDEIIRIPDTDTIYQIRYSPGTEIEVIETLREKLDDLMQEFNQDN